MSDKTYEIIEMGETTGSPAGIKCNLCGFTTFNKNDVRDKYCMGCNTFHEGRPVEEAPE